MSRPILFITRSWHGTGGMQQLSRDLSHELENVYGERFTCVRPVSRGVAGWMGLCGRALWSASLLRGKRPFIHLGDASLLPLGSVLKRISGAQLSVTACGLDVIYAARWYQFLMRRFLPRADRIVCISAATRDAAVLRGADAAKTIIIPCGIGDVPVSADYDPLLLLTVGRLVPRKGVAWFIEHALPRILVQHPDVHYLVIGAGQEEVHIREVVQRLQLQRVVTVKTTCTNEERNAALKKAAVFVVPNIPRRGDMEGFGIVCIEASACGTPVAAAHLEGLTDAVIDGQTGRMFEPQNAESCAHAVSALLQTPMNRNSIAAVTQEHFNWRHLISRYQHDVFAE